MAIRVDCEVSGTMEVSLTFEFAFPQAVVSEDRIVLDAPFGYGFIRRSTAALCGKSDYMKHYTAITSSMLDSALSPF